MDKLVINLYVFREKWFKQMVKSLHLIAENDPALGFCQPQNNVGVTGPGPLTITNPLPALTIREKSNFFREWLDRFFFCWLICTGFPSRLPVYSCPLDFVKSQLYSPLSQHSPPPSPHSHPHLKIYCLRNIVRVFWEGKVSFCLW